MKMNVLTPHQLRHLMGSGKPFRLVDVRDEDEWDLCHLNGAVHIPLADIETLAPSMLDKSEPIIVYCHHGMRSTRAKQWLESKGYSQVANLVGGIDAWSTQVDCRVPRY